MWIHETESLRFLAANESFCQLYGYSRDDLSSLTVADVQVDPGDELAQLLKSGAPIDPQREWLTLKNDGTQISIRLYVNDVVAQGKQGKFVVVEDLTEQRIAEAQLRQLAHHDALTGLPNRILLHQRMQEAFDRADKDGHRVGIICMDLDRFKQVNDWYGHAVGDECLREVGKMLTRRLRGMDTVARTGGEEFTLVLGEVESVASAGIVARALLQIFSSPLQIEGNSVLLGASMGVAVYPDHSRDGARLWRSADAAMYRAKRAGGNQHMMVDKNTPGSGAAIEREAIDHVALESLELDRYRLHYQMQRSADGKLRGFEALLRLPAANLGFVSTERFIAIAEDSGLIHPVGRWVVHEACRQIAIWNAGRETPLRVAVNVSPLQLKRPEFAEEVRKVIEDCSIDASWLELEITERVVTNAQDILSSVNALSDLGVRFAIDDFGTGYSSLLQLQRLPVSTLKIDQSFVRQLTEASRSYPIVKAMISMGHSLQMEIIAEGVETEDQMRLLEKLHCDWMQGFLIARPGPPEVVEASLAAAQPLTERV